MSLNLYHVTVSLLYKPRLAAVLSAKSGVQQASSFQYCNGSTQQQVLVQSGIKAEQVAAFFHEKGVEEVVVRKLSDEETEELL